MKRPILFLIIAIVLNAVAVKFNVGGILRELTRLSVLVSLGYLIYSIIKLAKNNRK